jgi:hypothetical protein
MGAKKKTKKKKGGGTKKAGDKTPGGKYCYHDI